jgi:hypothetical protein
MSEKAVKDELRLFALESIVCQHISQLYQLLPEGTFDAVRQQAIEGTRRQTFAGADAAHSDLFSAELETAIDRLYGMIGHHLEMTQRRRPSTR